MRCYKNMVPSCPCTMPKGDQLWLYCGSGCDCDCCNIFNLFKVQRKLNCRLTLPTSVYFVSSCLHQGSACWLCCQSKHNHPGVLDKKEHFSYIWEATLAERLYWWQFVCRYLSLSLIQDEMLRNYRMDYCEIRYTRLWSLYDGSYWLWWTQFKILVLFCHI